MQLDRYASLNALRGLGALLVLFLHITCVDPVTSLFDRSYLAVDLFFILSGFVIAHVYGGKLVSRAISVKDYLRARFHRLYPMILCGVLISAIFPSAQIESRSLAAYLIAQAMIVPSLWVSGLTFPLNAPQWSLFLELLANVVHAGASKHLGLRNLCLVVAVSAATFAGTIWYFGSADVGMTRETLLGGLARVSFGFFTGILLYRLWKAGVLPKYANSSALAVAGFPLLVLWLSQAPLPVYIGDALVAMIAFPVLIWLAFSDPVPFRFTKLARHGGRLSYPVYVIHVPLIAGAHKFLDLDGSPALVRISYWAIVAALIVLLADRCEKLYEWPVRVSLKKRLLDKIAKGAEPTLADRHAQMS